MLVHLGPYTPSPCGVLEPSLYHTDLRSETILCVESFFLSFLLSTRRVAWNFFSVIFSNYFVRVHERQLAGPWFISVCLSDQPSRRPANIKISIWECFLLPPVFHECEAVWHSSNVSIAVVDLITPIIAVNACGDVVLTVPTVWFYLEFFVHQISDP